MLGRDREVFHAGRLGQGNPLLGVKVGRIEAVRHLPVLLYRNVESLHDPFGFRPHRDAMAVPLSGEQRIRTPVDEHAKFVLPEPSDPFFGGHLRRRALCQRGNHYQHRNPVLHLVSPCGQVPGSTSRAQLRRGHLILRGFSVQSPAVGCDPQLIDEVHSTLKHSQITGGRRFEHILSWIRGCRRRKR